MNDHHPFLFYRVLAFNAVPFILSGTIWWIQHRHRGRLLGRRRTLFLIALVSNTITSVLLLALILWIFSVEELPFGRAGMDRLFLSMIALGLLSAVVAFFGRGLSRGLLIANGTLVALEWWLFAGLGL